MKAARQDAAEIARNIQSATVYEELYGVFDKNADIGSTNRSA